MSINLANNPIYFYKDIEDLDLNLLGDKTYNYVTMEVTNGKNKIVILETGTWLILSNGRQIQIDEEDVEDIQKHRWWTAGPGYVGTEIDGKNVYLHRFLMKPDADKVVDHLNRNSYHNRRSNLQVKTPKENTWNRTANSNTGYVGVTRIRTTGRKYNASLYYNGELVFNKTFHTLVDARIARLDTELKHRGEHISGMVEELQYLIDNREGLIELDEYVERQRVMALKMSLGISL